MKVFAATVAAAAVAALSSHVVVVAEDVDVNEAAEAAADAAAAHPAAPPGAVFFQSFDGDVAYHLSNGADYAGQDVQVKTIEGGAYPDDKGLVLMADAHRYGVTMDVDGSNADTDGDFVVQYEVRLSKGLECGGAYLKLLDANALPTDGNVSPDSPYIIMFGPDKCGDVNKIHFILRHQNPVSKEWEEKHFKPDSPVPPPMDKFSHLYTLVVRPDNTFTIKVDNTVVQSGNLLESLTPAINPPEEIDDPDDKKPSDWVDDAKIPDPEASKPEDWDEDAPMTILDMSVEKPEGWLEDEAYLIPDPEAEQPDEWDEEDDGEWEAPTVKNPKCATAPGCEKWVRPTINNPAYKGKWSAPMIDNEAYMGEWAPRKIANPNFFVDTSPAKSLVGSVGAVAVEVWIHKHGGVVFDNILVSTDEEAAAALADSSFKRKSLKEKGAMDDLERQRRHQANLKLLDSGGILGVAQYYIFETRDLAREWPIAAAGAGLITVVLLIYLCCSTCCAAGDDEGFEDPDEATADGNTSAKPTAAAVDADDDDDAPAVPAVAQATGDDDDDDEDDDDDDEPPALKSNSDKKND